MIKTDYIFKYIYIISLIVFVFYSCNQNSLSLKERDRFKTSIYHNDKNYINYILLKKIDLNNEKCFGYLPIDIAVISNNIETVKLFLKHGAKINQRDLLTNSTCIYDSRSIEMTRFLIDNGAEINLQNHQGYTPLHNFVGRNLDIMKLLIKNGADINRKDNNGCTPIFFAIIAVNE